MSNSSFPLHLLVLFWSRISTAVPTGENYIGINTSPRRRTTSAGAASCGAPPCRRRASPRASRSRPLRTKEGLQHLGQRDGPAGPQAREASSSKTGPLEPGDEPPLLRKGQLHGELRYDVFRGSSFSWPLGRVHDRGACFSGGPPMGHPCQRWFNIEISAIFLRIVPRSGHNA